MSCHTLARQYNGVKTWGFSQSSIRVAIHYVLYGPKGICAALSAHWIRAHAMDESLPAKLGLTATQHSIGPFSFKTYASLNIGRLRVIAQDFKRWGSRNGPGQLDSIKNWLDHQGMNRRPAMCDEYDIFAGCPNLEYDIAHQLRNVRSAYAYISFGRFAGSGHAVAAWVGASGEDVCFFDPNYGEYWFQNKTDFFRFFPVFYQRYYKGPPFNFNGRWKVEAFAKRLF